MEVEEHVPLSSLTTFRIGGPARYLLTLEQAEELPDALAFARREALPIIPLGGGSNILASDGSIQAVFVRLRAKRVDIQDDGNTAVLSADAGAVWDDIVRDAVERELWGIENLSAIPGTMGAAVVQNIGAYGAALSDTLTRVDAFDLETGVFRSFQKDACRFGYRASLFKEERDRYFVTRVTLVLSKTPAPNISYRDLRARFAGAVPRLPDIRAAVTEIRRGKFPPLTSFGTAGSFFLNPIVRSEDIATLSARFPGMPFFPLPEGGMKLPLAWILDRALNLKGLREGNAFLWEAQALVIATEPGARATDIVALASRVSEIVLEKTGIAITPEVRLLISSESRE